MTLTAGPDARAPEPGGPEVRERERAGSRTLEDLHPRVGLGLRDRLSLAAALAVLLACSSLQPVFDSLDWFPRTVGAVLVVALVSVGVRRLDLPRPLQPVATTAALLAYLVVVFAGSTLHVGVLPGAGSVRALHALLQTSGTDLAQYAPPAPATDALVLLVVGGVGLVAVAVDAMAGVLGRPAAAGLPLLALFAVPSAVLPGGLGWLPFVLGAAGWLGLLLVEGRDQAARWGTPLRSSSVNDPAGLGRLGRRIGGAALAVAVLVPLLIPGLHGRLLDGGSGGGNGSGGSRSVVTYNPITRLRGELTLPDPIRILHYTTSDPEPDYLRMTTLGVYDGSGWRQEVLRGNLRDNGVNDPIPTPVGHSASMAKRTVAATVGIDSLDAFWLPLPATPSTVDIKGPWMWDAGSESVFATRSNTSKVESYVVRSTRVLPDPALLAAQPALPAQVKPYATPIQATAVVRALTAQVIRGQTSEYGKATAIQAFFRNPKNGFQYSAETTTGGSPDALEDFLRQRRGFCEQYSSAMAAMLRLAGVPSRVAVGFTPGAKQPDGSYVVTTSEAHAWPEAWFDGAGWVRFEPTPSRGGITPPVYGRTATTAASPQIPAAGAATGQGTGPDGALTPAERREQQLADQEARTAAVPVARAPRHGLAAVPLALLVGLGAVLVLALLPGLLHVARRRRRWRDPSAATAWLQLRDDARDTGHAWYDWESPRATAARLRDEGGLSEPGLAAIARLARAVERERYARPARDLVAVGGAGGTAAGGGGGRTGAAAAGGRADRTVAGAAPAQAHELRADAATARRALRAATGHRRRLRVALLPPSTLAWASSRAGSGTADLLDAVDSGLAALGSGLRRR